MVPRRLVLGAERPRRVVRVDDADELGLPGGEVVLLGDELAATLAEIAGVRVVVGRHRRLDVRERFTDGLLGAALEDGEVADALARALLLAAEAVDVGGLADTAGLPEPLLDLPGESAEALLHADALYEAAPEPKRLHIVEGVGHNDLVTVAGEHWATAIARFSAAVASA